MIKPKWIIPNPSLKWAAGEDQLDIWTFDYVHGLLQAYRDGQSAEQLADHLNMPDSSMQQVCSRYTAAGALAETAGVYQLPHLAGRDRLARSLYVHAPSEHLAPAALRRDRAEAWDAEQVEPADRDLAYRRADEILRASR